MRDYSDIINIKRPPLKHPRMSLENRAKAYAPFDALRGFSLAILTKQVEQELVPRVTLSEDAQEQLDQKLRWLAPGENITVTFFRMERRIGDLEVGTYVTETGPVEEVALEDRALVLPGCYIPVEDIIKIESSGLNAEVEPYAG